MLDYAVATVVHDDFEFGVGMMILVKAPSRSFVLFLLCSLISFSCVANTQSQVPAIGNASENLRECATIDSDYVFTESIAIRVSAQKLRIEFRGREENLRQQHDEQRAIEIRLAEANAAGDEKLSELLEQQVVQGTAALRQEEQKLNADREARRAHEAAAIFNILWQSYIALGTRANYAKLFLRNTGTRPYYIQPGQGRVRCNLITDVSDDLIRELNRQFDSSIHRNVDY